MLLTRLPVPRLPESAFQNAGRATWAYPLVGLILGGLAVLIWFVLLAIGLPNQVAAALTLAALVVMTGALHEDGLADTADGFWGGRTAERRLEIMRDSRIGSYGVLALVLSQLVRFLCMSLTGPAALIVAATVSRAVLPAMMMILPHARNDGLAHSVGRPAGGAVLAALAIGLLTSIFLAHGHGLLGAVAMPAFIAWIACAKINGQTGDVLGATQQVTEIAVLLALVPGYVAVSGSA